MPRPKKALKSSLRIAAAAALALAMSPSLGSADDPECADSVLAKLYTEIETSLGTVGLCLIHDDSQGYPGNPDVTLITDAFLTAARQGVFENSFFHRSNTCPDLISCSARLHGGSFRLAAGEIDEVPDTGAWDGLQYPPLFSGYSNDEGTISVVRNGADLEGDWFINLQDNGWKLDWPKEAYEMFGLVVSGMDLVYEIADLPTVDTARPPSRLHVRYAESACLSGEALEQTPEAELDDCPCPDGVGDDICIPAADYPDTLSEPDLWVRVEDYLAPCISGDDSGTDPCDCSETDLCIKAETYLGTLHGYVLKVSTDADPEPCISGDESGAAETCECIEPNCVLFESYLGGFESQLYVKLPTPPCISGDDETEPCDCPEEDKGEGGPCVPFSDYVAASAGELKVNLAHPACLSGDAPTGETDSCVCRAIDLDPGIARCVRAEDYAEEYPDLQVREDGSEPCLSGDDDDDNDEEDPQCRCTEEEDPCTQAVCSEAKIQADTCTDGDDGYLHRHDEQESFLQQVWPGQDACISGDAPGEEDCPCTEDDQTDGTCVMAKSYLEKVFVREVPGETPCISGDDDDDNVGDPPACPCSEQDIEEGDCISREEYVADPENADVQVRIGDHACLSGDEPSESCVCGEDDCVPAASYFDSEDLPARRWFNKNDDCIHGDDAELDERCSCTDEEKGDDTCVTGVEYISGYSDLWVRVPVPPCIGTDHIDGDDSCPCLGADPPCQDAADYLLLPEFVGLRADFLVPLIDPGPDPILNINSSTLVLIPEPSSPLLEAAALVALALLSSRRGSRSSCQRL